MTKRRGGPGERSRLRETGEGNERTNERTNEELYERGVARRARGTERERDKSEGWGTTSEEVVGPKNWRGPGCSEQEEEVQEEEEEEKVEEEAEEEEEEMAAEEEGGRV